MVGAAISDACSSTSVTGGVLPAAAARMRTCPRAARHDLDRALTIVFGTPVTR
jgi:hypothetical protein